LVTKRHVRLHAVGGGVAQHGVTAAGQTLLDLPGYLARQPGEDDRALEVGMVVEYRQVGDVPRHPCPESPIGRLVVRLAGRALGGDEFGDLEPGVTLQQLREALPDVACGAEDGDRDFG
jgi:hypothetical protein